MNKTIGFQLIVYGLLLGGLSYLTHHLAPSIARLTLIAGLAGSALCLVWGVRAVRGSRGKALPVLTLLPICYVMLSQTVMSWGGGSEELPGRRAAALFIPFLFALSIGMLIRVAYAGVVFEGQPSSAIKEDESRSLPAGKPAAQASSLKRA
jgi:hypothetical protein